MSAEAGVKKATSREAGVRAQAYQIVLLPGDGIGPEVTAGAVEVLRAVEERFGLRFDVQEALVGGAAIDAAGTPLPQETFDLCQRSDAILLGAVGGPKWDSLKPEERPEIGALLPLRGRLGLFANLRPARLYEPLIGASSLRAEVVRGLDLLVLRELTGGLYFGTPKGIKKEGKGHRAINTLTYTTSEIERVTRMAFELAQGRRRKVTSVDKANVLESGQLWREVVSGVSTEFPEVEIEHMYVDNCAMQLIRDPRQFDVLLTGNLFGDILSDEAAMLTGSIGMLPSASLGPRGDAGPRGLFEPVHGTAPEIAGRNVANPIATILSTGMMLEFALGQREGAQAVERAVVQVLEKGGRTADIASPGTQALGTREMSSLIAQAVREGT